MLSRRIKIASIIFGLWSLIGLLICALCLTELLVVSHSEQGTEILLFLGAVIPFGFCAVMMTRIGCNASQYSSRESKQKYMLRVTQIARFFPISSIAFLLVMAGYATYAALRAQRMFGIVAIALFYAVAAFVEIRLLVSGDSLLETWAIEDDR